ncbi:MAG: endonuclease III [Actinomycetota bacterium]
MALPRGARHRVESVTAELALRFPGTAADLCALNFETPFQLLAATILSAQCTDERVNEVTKKLFKVFPDPESMAAAPIARLEELVHSTGFYRAKAANLKAMATRLVEVYGGVLPQSVEDLITFAGVGRKTANVLRSVAFDLPGLPVDTHVGRLSRRMKLSLQESPEGVEADLNRMIEAQDRGVFSLRLILFGRAVCVARKPRCEICPFLDWCPSSSLPIR